LQRSAIAECVPGTDARCQLMAGMFSAVFSTLAQRRLCVRELACSRALQCSFAVVSQARQNAVDAAIASGVSSGAALAQALDAGAP
jgi:hypothetical protein